MKQPYLERITTLCFTDGNIHQGRFTFADVDLNPLELADIQGGDAVENAEILLSVLQIKQVLT